MIKKIMIVALGLLVIVFIAIKGFSFLKKVQVNTVDPQASFNIENSKKDGFFLKQYKVSGISENFFQVSEAWIEYTWKNNIEGDRIVKTKIDGMQLNLKLDNFLASGIQNDRYMLDWEMRDIVNGSFRKSSVYSVFIKGNDLPDSFDLILNQVKDNIVGEKFGQLTITEKK
ncbi:MAG TPA: hypothetical protein PK275_12325 [Chitinophagaceae bacterium]|jgi:hypothetical protein|nr:hypothetical protein [Chitinophagaceae bacterium]